MRFKTIESHFGSVTLFRVVKVCELGMLTDVHVYNNKEVAYTVTQALNESIGV